MDLFSCFLIRVLSGNQLFGNWIRFLEPKLLLMKSACCFEKDFALLCFPQTSENTTRGSTIGIRYCHAWCRFIIAILVLAKGIPFADRFSCYFL